MSEISTPASEWQKPALKLLGARDGREVPATIDLADGGVVVDLSEHSKGQARKPQAT